MLYLLLNRHYASEIALNDIKTKNLDMRSFLFSNLGDQTETVVNSSAVWKIETMNFFSSVSAWFSPLVTVLTVKNTMQIVYSFPEPIYSQEEQQLFISTCKEYIAKFIQ